MKGGKKQSLSVCGAAYKLCGFESWQWKDGDGRHLLCKSELYAKAQTG